MHFDGDLRFHTTGEIADRLGITRRTLHFYEEIGLVRPSEKGVNGQRLYTDEQVSQIEFITLLKNLGLALEDIRHLLQVRGRHGTDSQVAAGEVRSLLADLLPRIRHRIDELQRLERELLVGSTVMAACEGCTEHAHPGQCRGCTIMQRTAPQSLRAIWLSDLPQEA